ncbi:SDR family oxidoreductase [Spongiibacter sp. KMU-166]|uniref:SDR family oxidoreductase n=1 Tax=Spongiibacter thalassae TaxID=2721624 RepID=A0ABX1GJQ4_9GAMM|nr:SDR family oxidoreductase [Spongiibacter thalassae]NKI18697.1 SDR family oxidoreductase [Spongiibacter thalassae]
MSYLIQQFSLEGKTALVTGGARGIGEMIAKGLILAGAKVYITSRKLEDLEQKVEEFSQLGQCVGLVADVSSMAGIETLAAQITERESQLDILINNAGKTWGAPLESFPEKAWDDVMTINTKAPFMLIQKLLPLLRGGSAAQPHHIVNIGSIAGISKDSLSAYSYGTSKAAIHHLTGVLAKDLVKDHINVNAIAPGHFPSKMTAGIMKTDEAKEAVLSTIPMGRMGAPEDIANLAIYLCSSRYMTGNIIPIDGGTAL